MKFAILAKNVDVPPFGYANSYELPSNFVRVVDIRQSADLRAKAEKYSIVGTCVYTNASPCYARLILVPTGVSSFPDYFCEAFVKKLASEIAPVLSDDASLGLKMAELYEQSVRMGLLIDASMQNEEEEDERQYSSFMRVR